MRFESLLGERGISAAEWVALRTLYDRQDRTHASLIQMLGMTEGAISKVVTKLESKGLVDRSIVDDGAREQALSLTASGRRMVVKLAKLADENDQFFFAHLDSGKRKQRMSLLQELVEHHRFMQVPVE